MIHARFSYTLRSPHPSSEWTCVHDNTRHFPDMATALAAVKEQYSHVKKRQPIYNDTVSRGTIQCGWVYCFKGDREEYPGDTRIMYHQDWVTFLEADYRAVDVRKKENR